MGQSCRSHDWPDRLCVRVVWRSKWALPIALCDGWKGVGRSKVRAVGYTVTEHSETRPTARCHEYRPSWRRSPKCCFIWIIERLAHTQTHTYTNTQLEIHTHTGGKGNYAYIFVCLMSCCAPPNGFITDFWWFSWLAMRRSRRTPYVHCLPPSLPLAILLTFVQTRCCAVVHHDKMNLICIHVAQATDGQKAQAKHGRRLHLECMLQIHLKLQVALSIKYTLCRGISRKASRKLIETLSKHIQSI